MVTVIQYRLRGGAIQPKLAACSGAGTPDFYAQTFGAEKVLTEITDAKTQLLSSEDFQGQKLGDIEDPAYRESTYTRASYQGRALRTTDGDLVFSGSEEFVSEWIEEESIGT
jgi:hypothetical protein